MATTGKIQPVLNAIEKLESSEGGVAKLDSVLDEILKLHENEVFFRPWQQIDYETELLRHNAYVSLEKQLGPLYARCSFQNYRVTHPDSENQASAKLSLQLYAEKLDEYLADRCGLVLYGKPGTGKDHLMTATMFWAILNFGYRVLWINGLDLYEQARERIDSGSSEREFVQKFSSPLILAISDPLPPRGDLTKYNVDLLFRIIDRRTRDLKTTWVTMNVHGGEEAETRMAQNIIDRLRDHSLCLSFDWPSYRKPK